MHTRLTPVGHRAGYATIAGRPNVGKSTLLNALVGAKLAIVTPKPQTTRTRVLGIRTLPDAQVLFVDTPGIHRARSLLNRRMVDAAQQAVREADVVLLVLDAAEGLTPEDEELGRELGARGTATVCVLNKIDRVRPPALLPVMEALGGLLPGREVIPASARTGEGLDGVLAAVIAALPEGPALYPADEQTTETERFLAQEIVREQVLLQTEQEVPYGTAVVVEEFREEPERNLRVVKATIVVARDSHKGIMIGAGGGRLREIGRRARLGLEARLGGKVFLELFVRVEPGWAENRRRLRELGL